MQGSAKIYLEILGAEVACEVDYNYRPGYPACTCGPPEHCYEACDDEVEFNAFQLYDVPKDKGPPTLLDCPPWLKPIINAEIEERYDEIREQAARDYENDFDEDAPRRRHRRGDW
jgi:hypothetical protein